MSGEQRLPGICSGRAAARRRGSTKRTGPRSPTPIFCERRTTTARGIAGTASGRQAWLWSVTDVPPRWLRNWQNGAARLTAADLGGRVAVSTD
ncbi:hypothetical protein BST45_20060 [Mycobacterium shinjukuense]|uniref:Uncharacterized protein n=1 Tax=Mycobacterium shinjukuense TaxID=398694 RepID=A0A7I7MKT3_9MYCO|nr:hypothetical protein BST45_20060 [Mycobacterium shinjukuense]BBX72387.1 hypothetical protein MSHI_02930 [Mycobacterium shinjukuense]